MRETFVVGNWKMNGSRETNAPRLARLASGWKVVAGRTLAVSVPAPYLQQAQAALTGSAVAWGAQDVSEHESGAYTGDVAASMVTDFGGTFAIVGHSECREYSGDTNETVAKRTAAALAAGLHVIACVGETLEQREAGETADVLRRQVSVFEHDDNLVVAYEPIWAIGTGKTATPDMAHEAHELIKSVLDVPVLYGGSVKPDNAAELMAKGAVDGALVGGASLEVESFAAICRAAIPS